MIKMSIISMILLQKYRHKVIRINLEHLFLIKLKKIGLFKIKIQIKELIKAKTKQKKVKHLIKKSLPRSKNKTEISSHPNLMKEKTVI
jgi:hypothetical protein